MESRISIARIVNAKILFFERAMEWLGLVRWLSYKWIVAKNFRIPLI